MTPYFMLVNDWQQWERRGDAAFRAALLGEQVAALAKDIGGPAGAMLDQALDMESVAGVKLALEAITTASDLTEQTPTPPSDTLPR